MARNIADIQAQINQTYVANMAAIGITIDTTTWSATNLQRLFIYTVAFAINVLEQLFDLFKADVNTALAELKPHTARWYANMAKAYQHGFNLYADSDQYDNAGHTDDQVTASKKVAYAAVVEQTNTFGRIYLRMKLAGTDGTDLIPLTDEQLTGFEAYMNRVKDAGVALQISSTSPDSIKQEWVIYYDPLILNSSGNRLDGTSSAPVQDAIKAYLTALPFNGIYVPQYHIDAVQAVEGVVTLNLAMCQTQYGALPYTSVGALYTPDAGYLRFPTDGDLVITWIAQEAIK